MVKRRIFRDAADPTHLLIPDPFDGHNPARWLAKVADAAATGNLRTARLEFEHVKPHELDPILRVLSATSTLVSLASTCLTPERLDMFRTHPSLMEIDVLTSKSYDKPTCRTETWMPALDDLSALRALTSPLVGPNLLLDGHSILSHMLDPNDMATPGCARRAVPLHPALLLHQAVTQFRQYRSGGIRTPICGRGWWDSAIHSQHGVSILLACGVPVVPTYATQVPGTDPDNFLDAYVLRTDADGVAVDLAMWRCVTANCSQLWTTDFRLATAFTPDGGTLLHYLAACTRGQDILAALESLCLLDRLRGLFPTPTKGLDAQGRSPLAVYTRDPNAREPRVLRFFAENGLDPNLVAHDGLTAFEHAADQRIGYFFMFAVPRSEWVHPPILSDRFFESAVRRGRFGTSAYQFHERDMLDWFESDASLCMSDVVRLLLSGDPAHELYFARLTTLLGVLLRQPNTLPRLASAAASYVDSLVADDAHAVAASHDAAARLHKHPTPNRRLIFVLFQHYAKSRPVHYSELLAHEWPVEALGMALKWCADEHVDVIMPADCLLRCSEWPSEQTLVVWHSLLRLSQATWKDHPMEDQPLGYVDADGNNVLHALLRQPAEVVVECLRIAGIVYSGRELRQAWHHRRNAADQTPLSVAVSIPEIRGHALLGILFARMGAKRHFFLAKDDYMAVVDALNVPDRF